MIFLGELNNLELWGADIGNTYLEAYTKEKLFIIGGAEFEELEGFILIFNKALYGLKSSGKRWAERFYDIIMDMEFMPSKADPCTECCIVELQDLTLHTSTLAQDGDYPSLVLFAPPVQSC